MPNTNTVTVNTLMILMKQVRSRINDLRSIRQSSANRTVQYYGENRTENSPEYNVKLVDKKITELETWLFKADAAIKQSNAKTEVSLEVDVDKLLEPLV